MYVNLSCVGSVGFPVVAFARLMYARLNLTVFFQTPNFISGLAVSLDVVNVGVSIAMLSWSLQYQILYIFCSHTAFSIYRLLPPIIWLPIVPLFRIRPDPLTLHNTAHTSTNTSTHTYTHLRTSSYYSTRVYIKQYLEHQDSATGTDAGREVLVSARDVQRDAPNKLARRHGFQMNEQTAVQRGRRRRCGGRARVRWWGAVVSCGVAAPDWWCCERSWEGGGNPCQTTPGDAVDPRCATRCLFGRVRKVSWAWERSARLLVWSMGIYWGTATVHL
ncbi:uncharacterized protein K452DRAFT_70009 [Aplosporella prunicola CBS 121167]|uniref:Uncharacterized protein n=1 Tax=Aplosporella prunicola CBS 121167 TaxID=1176127 RepID=A0A6A6BRL8_9PEZI|nr:uncharacterized protein K452DRAFT_70009 [Aplosporella prunicola CBS 121167]KAF2146732.1 hypothetical protein K452DRAFT_70009 [Aplosporella prunicola CBS 121167]